MRNMYAITPKGVIALKDIPPGTVIAKIYDRENVTGFADKDYFINHIGRAIIQKEKPNCGVARAYSGGLYLVSVRPIRKGEQITSNFKTSRYLQNTSKEVPQGPEEGESIGYEVQKLMGTNWDQRH